MRPRFTEMALLMAFLGSPVAASVSETQAVKMVFDVMHRVDPGVSANCLSLQTESVTPRLIELAVREIHNRRCGGDPVVSPVIERFRVGRESGKIWRWDAAEDDYHRVLR